MKIKETQYFEDNPDDYRQRIIEIDNWDEYTKQFYKNTMSSMTNSLPRLRTVKKINRNSNSIKVKFMNEWFGKIIIHESLIVDNKEPERIIRSYDSIPKERKFNYPKFWGNNLEAFKKEYECVFFSNSKEE